MKYVLPTQISIAFVQFVIVFALLRFKGVEALGHYGLIVSILNPLQQFFKLGIPKLIALSVNNPDVKRLARYGYIVAVVFLISTALFSNIVYKGEYQLLFLIVLVQKVINNVRDVTHALYIREKCFKNFFYSGFIFNMLSVIVFLVTQYCDYSIEKSLIMVCVILLSGVFIDLFYLTLALHYKNEKVTKYISKALIKQSVKQSVSDAVNTLKSSMPRYVIMHLFGSVMLGVYVAISQAVSVIEVINQALLKYNYKNLTDSFESSIKSFIKIEFKIYKKIIILSTLAILINALIGKQLIIAFLDKSLEEYYWLLLLLITDRCFSMLNSIPKTTYVLLKKIEINIVIPLLFVFAIVVLSLIPQGFKTLVFNLMVLNASLFAVNRCYITYLINKRKC